MYDFIRTAAIVPRLIVGDTDANTKQIIEKAKEADKKNADIAVFPELCLTGYTCADLFFQTALQKSVSENIVKILNENISCILMIGAPLILCGQLYNCSLVISDGKICGIIPKTFIPNYNEFYEKRWFSSSAELNLNEISSLEIGLSEDYAIPVGRDLIFSLNNEIKFGIEICEDLWAPITPGKYLAVNGAELIINLSASNETIAKREYRHELISCQSAALICGYVYASAGAEESTTDLVFSGHSVIAENGTIIAENQNVAESDSILIHDIDIGKIKSDRMQIKTFKDSAALYGKHEPCRTITINRKNIYGDGNFYTINKQPFVPYNKKDRIDRCKNIFEIQISGLKKRMMQTGAKPVIGVSGGLDSTLALLVCVKSAERLGKPLTDVIGITMPCFGTTGRTYNNSLKLMQSLGITSKEINIKEACIQHFEDIGHDEKIHDITYENCQARERTQVLMDYAGENGGFVVGTGDLSELALGWCTYNADHMSMYGVNAGIPKTLVKWMIDSIVEYNLFPTATEILKDILDTPISPELLPPDENGKISQKTEDIIGPYELHDFFLYNIIRFGFSPSKVYYLSQKAFEKDFDNATLLKWLKNFYRRFFSQQFKRSCLPDSVKVGSLCLSPRGDWRMPSDASATIWLREIEKL